MTSALGRYIESSLEDHIKELEERAETMRRYQKEHDEKELLHVYYRNMAQTMELEVMYLQMMNETVKKLDAEAE